MHNIECIDTGKVRPRERLDFWNEQAGDKVTPVVVDKIGNGDFSGVLTARNTSCFSLSFLRATPSRVLSRSLGQHRGIVTLSLIKKGTAYSRSGGYEAQLMPNDFVMYDSDTVLEAVYPEGIELLSIRLSAVDLELYLPRARELVGRRVPGTSKSGIVFSQFINCVWDQVTGSNRSTARSGR